MGGIGIGFTVMIVFNLPTDSQHGIEMPGQAVGVLHLPRGRRLQSALSKFTSRILHASCPDPAISGPVHVAVLLTTSRYYRQTRLRHVLASWARHAQALVLASDEQLGDLLPDGAGEVVL